MHRGLCHLKFSYYCRVVGDETFIKIIFFVLNERKNDVRLRFKINYILTVDIRKINANRKTIIRHDSKIFQNINISYSFSFVIYSKCSTNIYFIGINSLMALL